MFKNRLDSKTYHYLFRRLNSTGTYLSNFLDSTSERAVSDVDSRSNFDSLWEGRVGAGDFVDITFDGVIGDNLQVLSSLEGDGSVIDEETSTNLGTLSVEHDGTGLIWSLLESLSEVGNGASVGLVVTMREVETGNIHASVEHLDKHVDVPAGRSECANDLGLAGLRIDGLENVVEADVA